MVLVPFLSGQENWRTTRPPSTPFFPKSSDQNFEMAFLFSIVKKPNNCVFGDKLTPLGERFLCNKIYSLFWEVYIHFFGLREDDEFLVGRILHRQNFSMEKEASDGALFQGRFYTG